MKNLLFIIFIFFALTANAQNYLISFAGTGASTTVLTVKVENLTKATSLILNGSDILRLTGTTGISQDDYEKSSGMKIYPNPMTNNSRMEIYPPVAGDAIIRVYDMTGRLIVQIQSYLENYLQEFRLSGINSGFYLISVKGNTYQYSGKLLCNGKADGTIRIEKISNNQAVVEKTVNMDHKGTQATVDMAYTPGDRLKFKAISGNYSTVITDIPASDKAITFNFIAAADGDNNHYTTLQIGTQTWMAENLKTTKYLNGDLIGTTVPATKNILSESNPKYQWSYDGNESNVATYGRLYTWYTVADNRGVCPAGWHIPTDAEWTTLTDYLGGASIASGKLKESGLAHWGSPNTGSTNETGFTALPGGARSYDGTFFYIQYGGTWWGSTLHTQTDSYGRGMVYNGVDVGYTYGANEQKAGFSVRCVKN
jgi:uncharacterized protein (TIGR02145 family)